MVYDLLASLAGTTIGCTYFWYIRPVLKVSRQSGVSLVNLKFKKAISLEEKLSDWSGMFSNLDMLWKVDEYSKTLPDNVQEAWKKHINFKGLSTCPSEYVNDKYKMKDKVKEFYKEPVVQEYLKRAA